MTKQPLTAIVLAISLGGILLYLNRDWFAKDPIQIYHRVQLGRSFAGRYRADSSPGTPVFFGFNRKLKLTLIKIVPLGETQTNQFAQPLWEMISDSNSLPTKGFVYGLPVPGMRPYLKGAAAKPLVPGVPYRLLVQARSLKAQHDFSLDLDPAAPN